MENDVEEDMRLEEWNQLRMGVECLLAVVNGDICGQFC